MKLLLTLQLLQFLKKEGFKYRYPRTSVPHKGKDNVLITLSPTRFKPDIHQLLPSYDTYFNIDEEPVQPAGGIDDVFVAVKLHQATLLAM